MPDPGGDTGWAALSHGPAAGYFDGAEHVMPLRVYYEDTDAGGIVYHASYLRFAERGRSELLRASGADNGSLMREKGLGFVARHCSLDYIAPARLDDALEVRTRIIEARGASFTAEQDVVREGKVIVRIAIRIACVAAEGRPGPMPLSLRSTLRRLVHEAAPFRPVPEKMER